MSEGNKSIIAYLLNQEIGEESFINQAKQYDYLGADELILLNFTENETEREAFLARAMHLKAEVDIPFMIGTKIKRFEDIKKALYTGASCVVVDYITLGSMEALTEGAKRFGGERILLNLDCDTFRTKINEIENLVKTLAIKGILLQITSNDDINEIIKNTSLNLFLNVNTDDINFIQLLKESSVSGIIASSVKPEEMLEFKRNIKDNGIAVNCFQAAMDFSSFKLNSDGLIPAITQDYETGEVLQLAYMNEEAYNMTIATGRMTYYSRSRNVLWVKGETSGHFQFVKQLDIDCDCDTILAKVVQIGAACHTGSRSCFFHNLVKKEYDQTNPLNVLTDVYSVIMDRKNNPKEGSYTNYLFDKGIDKILKKCGEEATEITIAAKNPNADELRYEIADYLYHLMVLMAECKLDWNDVMNELAHRK